ncbi:ATP-binding protein [Actinoallomurus soli]|uniref:ATP-binding protein n=1 Tax=Actinoallomurus soli TaxID=2952535 RepID=UPI00209269E1|nr:ATP-binding protein [Actinoallomurus soli]MCO5968823.1 ATP-binding protein [Actinoallomurus soli]
MTPDPAVADRVGPRSRRPAWLALHARPAEAARARSFASAEVFGLPFDPYEIGLVTSEIVTNAIRAALALRPWPDDLWPIGVQMTTTHRYVYLAVTDPDGRRMAAPDDGGLLAEHGRGLSIVDHLAAARWVTYAEHGKTVHVVITASEVTLTPTELQWIRDAR